MKLGAYLEKHGISQEEFGKKLNPPVSQGLVWQWVNGKTAITPAKAKDIEAVTEGEVSRMECLYPDEARPAGSAEERSAAA